MEAFPLEVLLFGLGSILFDFLGSAFTFKVLSDTHILLVSSNFLGI